MSENSWVLKGVEPEVREKAVAEAARLGVNVGDYLTDMLLRSALIDHVNASAEAEIAPSAHEEAVNFAPPPESPEGFAVRHRLKGLERRLSASVGGLDGAIHAVDTALYDVTARLGETEALAGDTAHALGQTQQEINNVVTGLQLHIAVIEDNLGALGQAQDERAGGLSHRIDYVESQARAAQQANAVLADAHETLKHAVAEDFSVFAHEIADRLSNGLHDVRAAADAAAEQADTAVAHLIQELRTMRDVLDERVSDGVAETRSRVQAAFAETSERIAGLTDRVAENERFNSRVSEQLRAQIADVEDAAQIALEETAQGLRQTATVLAADIALAGQEHRAALENTRVALSAEIIAVREDQLSQLARLKLVDVAVGNTINELGMVREAVESRLRSALDDAQTETDARFDALATRTNNNERETAHLRQTLIVEIERVEASTFASLEKLARDIASSDTAAQNHLDVATRSVRAELDALRNQVNAETTALREDQTGIAARLTLMDGALARVEAGNAPLAARLAQLEEASGVAETEQALALIREQIAALTERADDRRLEHTLTGRLADVEARTAAADESLQGVARMLNRVAAQSVESSQRAEERAHQVELALADVRLDQISLSEKANIGDLVLALEVRVAGMEQRQTDALHTLRNDVARFVADNDARLATLEDAPAPAPIAAPAASTDEMLAAFQDLRSRIEDRIHGIEQRSVRTLEQVADTVAMIEQRFIEAEASAERDVKSA